VTINSQICSDRFPTTTSCVAHSSNATRYLSGGRKTMNTLR